MSKEINHIYNETGEKPFTIANSDLLLNKDLTVNDKMIYLYLRLYGGQNRLAFTGLERMSEEINLSINTIRKSLKNLEGKKYIKITKEKQKHGYYLNNYHIFDPYNNNQEKIFDKENSIKKEQPIKDSSDNENLKIKKACEDIISYLNDKANKRYSTNGKEHIKYIKARLNEGKTIEQFKTIIDKKVPEWIDSDKMNKYLVPSTLFRPDNFEKYLNQKPIETKRQRKSAYELMMEKQGG